MNVTPPSDLRGRHTNRPNKIAPEVVSQIRDHILGIPRYKSHYSRSDNIKKYYLSPLLNVAKLHEMYLAKYEPNQYKLLQDGKQDDETFNPTVKYEFFRKYFTENFNISFGKPKSDSCQRCDKLTNKIEGATTEEEKLKFITEKKLHLAKAETFYTDLKEKTALSKTNDHVEVITFDFQQNLPLPVSSSSDVFYKIQLWVYNFCVTVASSGRSYFFVYNETVGGKGQNEVISMLHHFFKNLLKPEVTHLYMFSDNCASQNKNNVMTQFLYSLINTGALKFIYHRFPEPGHSYLPCDRSFGAVEQRKNKYDRIYLPSDYMKIIRDSGKKFEVIEVKQTMFLNYKDHFQPMFVKNPSQKNLKFTISKYRIFKYDITNIQKISCSVAVGLPNFDEFQILRKNEHLLSMPNDTQFLYSERRKLKKLKYEHIMSLAKSYVPLNDIWFYEEIENYHKGYASPENETSCSEFEDDANE